MPDPECILEDDEFDFTIPSQQEDDMESEWASEWEDIQAGR